MIEILNDLFLKEYKYIFKKYKPIKKIGEGSFGNVYSVIRLKDKSIYAMKTEKIDANVKMLESEAYTLYTLQNGFGIPKLITYGHNKNYNILIETLLGDSLENIFIKRKLKCNIIDVCAVGIQIIDRLEWIHSKNIIYRDIKPENFLVGMNDPNVIYVIDFGLYKKYRSSKTGKHILPKTGKIFNGNFKFSSSYTIRGKEPSRRDDIISLGYLLIYLIKKELPWDHTFKENKLINSKYIELVFLKDTNAYGRLFNGLPYEFKEFIEYAKNLKFEQDPNYSYLRSILNKIIVNNNFNYERYHFSWINFVKKGEDLSVSKKHYSKRRNLHQRLLKSFEKNKDNSIQNKKNISSPPNSTLNRFKSINFEENKLSNMNNIIGEESILKTENIEGNKILPKSNILFKKEQYLNSINKEGNKIIICNNNFTNSYSKNSISNSKVSFKSLIPKNIDFTSEKNLNNKKITNNNKLQRSNAQKSIFYLKKNLKINNNCNNYSKIKNKLNHNSCNY